jgi:hypothetical protein
MIKQEIRNTKVSTIFQELIVDAGLTHIANVFRILIKEGIYKDVGAMIIALQFYSPMYLLLSKYDNQPKKYKEAVTLLEEHMQQCNNLYTRRTK